MLVAFRYELFSLKSSKRVSLHQWMIERHFEIGVQQLDSSAVLTSQSGLQSSYVMLMLEEKFGLVCWFWRLEGLQDYFVSRELWYFRFGRSEYIARITWERFCGNDCRCGEATVWGVKRSCDPNAFWTNVFLMKASSKQSQWSSQKLSRVCLWSHERIS